MKTSDSIIKKEESYTGVDCEYEEYLYLNKQEKKVTKSKKHLIG